MRTKKVVEQEPEETEDEDGVDTLVVASKVKKMVKSLDIRCSSDFVEGLSKYVFSSVQAAVERAKENGRGTVRPFDL